MSDLLNIPLTTIAGDETTLADYDGSVLLIVNVASKCGLTPQYEALEQLYRTYHEQGFEVLGFPANNFAGQEPGTNDEIAEFCSTTFDVDFPLFSKISVVGEDQHPLYKELTTLAPRAEGDPDGMREQLKGHGLDVNEDPDILWNFEKFLVDRRGDVVARFAPSTTPDDPLAVAAIESALAG